MRRRVGASVGEQLAGALDRLMRGDLDLVDLDPSLAAWYFAGWNAGRASRDAELTALRAAVDRERHAADRYYTAAFDRDGRAILRRMDERAARAPLADTDAEQYADMLTTACQSPRGHAA